MEISSKTSTRNGWRAGLAVCALCTALVPGAVAKNKNTERIAVIAHVTLPGASVSQMLLQQRGVKQYLSIQQAPEAEPIVVNVTKADHPEVVSHAALKASSEKVEMIGSGLALLEMPKNSKPGGARHAMVPSKDTEGNGQTTGSVRVLDLSDPKNPKTLRSLAGVTSVLADDRRQLIYIANGEGLWILSHIEKPSLPLCDSESVFSPIVDCQ